MIKSVDVYFWFIFYKTEERGELHGLKKEASYSLHGLKKKNYSLYGLKKENYLLPSRTEESGERATPFTD